MQEDLIELLVRGYSALAKMVTDVETLVKQLERQVTVSTAESDQVGAGGA